MNPDQMILLLRAADELEKRARHQTSSLKRQCYRTSAQLRKMVELLRPKMKPQKALMKPQKAL
jgi:hypothetical protein